MAKHLLFKGLFPIFLQFPNVAWSVTLSHYIFHTCHSTTKLLHSIQIEYHSKFLNFQKKYLQIIVKYSFVCCNNLAEWRFKPFHFLAPFPTCHGFVILMFYLIFICVMMEDRPIHWFCVIKFHLLHNIRSSCF